MVEEERLSPVHPALEQAIEDLYAVFARYPLRARIDGCPHCALEQRERALHTAPLRKLPEEHVGYFAFKAMTTFGDEDDFRHFFPRIAELLSVGGGVHACSLGTIVSKLEYGRWRAWPEPEQHAIERWIDALWTSFVGDPGYGGPHWEHLLDAALVAGVDLREHLSRWARAQSWYALDHLAHVVLHTAAASNFSGIAYSGKPWGAELDAWVRTDPDVRRALHEVSVPEPRDDTKQLIAAAIDAFSFPPFT